MVRTSPTHRIKLAASSWHRILHAWLYVPCGILIILLACFGVDSLIGLSSVSFPASVACMIVLFVALVVSELALGDKKSKKIVSLVEIPVIESLIPLNPSAYPPNREPLP
jgi:purine-cytosine permease-like protein